MNTSARKNRFSLRGSLKLKITLAITAIVAILLLSSVISVLEFRRMNNSVSELVDQNISSIDVTSSLSFQCENYNLEILSLLGSSDSLSVKVPFFDTERFLEQVDSLRGSFTSVSAQQAADSLCYSFAAYMLTSLEMEDVAKSSFIRSRDWFFNRLEPRFATLMADIDRLNEINFAQLQNNSASFDENLYRSLAPELVAVGSCILLCFLLLYFLITLYIKPLYRMLEELDSFRRYNRPYQYDFDGDDVLKSLNEAISDVAQSNSDLKKRLKALKER